MMEIIKTGMARRIDQQGRLVIPSEIRNNYGLPTGSMIEFLTTSEGLLLRLALPQCCVCGASDKPLHEVDGVFICHGCVDTISAQLGSWNEGR